MTAIKKVQDLRPGDHIYVGDEPNSTEVEVQKVESDYSRLLVHVTASIDGWKHVSTFPFDHKITYWHRQPVEESKISDEPSAESALVGVLQAGSLLTNAQAAMFATIMTFRDNKTMVPDAAIKQVRDTWFEWLEEMDA
jgi:hypothetical protein